MTMEHQRTPLYDEHVRLGARMISFGGWDMPVSYPTGIIAEHHATRHHAGLFDVSHMGEFLITGQAAPTLLDTLLTNNAGALPPGRALYSPMCRDDGTIVDDTMLYRLPPDAATLDPGFLLVVNASNIAKDLAWVHEVTARLSLLNHHVAVRDSSAATALIALQGPQAPAILARLAGPSVDGIARFAVVSLSIDGEKVLAARTGYTGEDGFELFVPDHAAVNLWRRLLAAGQPLGLTPAGLGARDTLRLEARLCLYGNDIDDTTTPLEAGLGWTVAWSRAHPFIGQDALARQREAGLSRRLVGLIMDDRAVPRHGSRVHAGAQSAGTITSGTMSPTLEKGIALAYLPADCTTIGTPLAVDVRGVDHPAHVVKTPFYRRKSDL